MTCPASIPLSEGGVRIGNKGGRSRNLGSNLFVHRNKTKQKEIYEKGSVERHVLFFLHQSHVAKLTYGTGTDCIDDKKWFSFFEEGSDKDKKRKKVLANGNGIVSCSS